MGMRMSGTYLFHSWRIVPNTDGSFNALIDGKDMGKLMSDSLEIAVFEIKQLVIEMIAKGQQ